MVHRPSDRLVFLFQEFVAVFHHLDEAIKPPRFPDVRVSQRESVVDQLFIGLFEFLQGYVGGLNIPPKGLFVYVVPGRDQPERIPQALYRCLYQFTVHYHFPLSRHSTMAIATAAI